MIQSARLGRSTINPKAILYFKTSPLPDTAVITKVTLKIKKSSVAGTDPFTTHGSLVADIRKGYLYQPVWHHPVPPALRDG
jgi:hypothetical protein